MNMTFQPQLSQQDLAEMIDREKLSGEQRKHERWPWEVIHDTSATELVENGYEIRLAPGALTEFGLKPRMEIYNPDGLSDEQITEGGKYRAMTTGDSCLTPGVEVWVAKTSEWIIATPINQEAEHASLTYRVPVNTPFPKQEHTPESLKWLLEGDRVEPTVEQPSLSPDSFQQDLEEKLDALPAGELEQMLEQSSATPNSVQQEIDPPLNCPHEVLRGYILSMKDGERVREMGKSALTGLEGTIYHNAEGVTCIMWDREPGDEGQMGTSFTGGARRINPTPEQSSPVQSDTPRTDENAYAGPYIAVQGDVQSYEHVDADFARQLERELTSALSQRDEARRLLGEAKEVLSDLSRYVSAGAYPDGPCLKDEDLNDVKSTLKQITEYLK